MFESLRDRNYRLWVVGQSVSRAGHWLQLVGHSILVLDLSGSGGVLGLAMALQFVPIVLLGPWAGVVADRVNKRRLLLVAQAALLVHAAVLGVLTLMGEATIQVVLVMAAANGVASAFEQPARRTFVAELVADGAMTNAVALSGAIDQCSKVAGPLLAGAVIAAADVGWCFILNAITSLAAVAALVRLRRMGAPVPAGGGRGADEVRAALGYARESPEVSFLLLTFGCIALTCSHWNLIIPLLATRDLEGTDSTYAVLTACMTAGSVIGTLWLARRHHVGAALLRRSAGTLGGAWLLVAASPSIWIAGAAIAALGAAAMIAFNGALAALQLATVPAMRGRIIAFYTMLVFGGLAVGGPAVGVIAERSGTRWAAALQGVAAVMIGARRPPGTEQTRPGLVGCGASRNAPTACPRWLRRRFRSVPP